MDTYDMVVIGSGPAGQKAAIAAAKLGRRAAVIERGHMVGGVCINTGTIPSKTLREAVLYLTGLNQRELYGQSYRVKDDITVTDLSARTQHVVAREIDVIRNQLARNHVHLIDGTARFTDPHTLEVTNEIGQPRRDRRRQDRRRGRHQAGPAGDRRFRRRDDRRLRPDPRAWTRCRHRWWWSAPGVIGIEYASMFAALGTKVTVVEKRSAMLDFCDKEIIEALQYQLRELAVTFRFSETVREVQKHPAGTLTILESGQEDPRRHGAVLRRPAGRHRRTEHRRRRIVKASNRGRVEVNENFQTEVEHIYAVGDVIGFPALAATAMEQGRRATYHAFGEPVGNKLGDLQPIGIYTIPEISYVGRTEEELTRENVPFEVGISRYRELARGAILGDSYGMLKILVHAESRELLGVHVFGTNATELVHIGQTVMGCGGTVDYLVDAVFNYPTLAESYKVAALDAVNKMRAIAKVTQTGIYHPCPSS